MEKIWSEKYARLIHQLREDGMQYREIVVHINENWPNPLTSKGVAYSWVASVAKGRLFPEVWKEFHRGELKAPRISETRPDQLKNPGQKRERARRIKADIFRHRHFLREGVYSSFSYQHIANRNEVDFTTVKDIESGVQSSDIPWPVMPEKWKMEFVKSLPCPWGDEKNKEAYATE